MRHNAAMLAFATADNAVTHEYAADSLYRHNVEAWSDATTPRTDKPVFFRFRDCGSRPLNFDAIIRRGDRSRIPA